MFTINPINICFSFTLVQYPGRTLVFVNSIKTARRLDGLLRALGINSRALHAQLQQKQRLNALESFTDLPVGVLGTA
jgi:ATP-dependent RNA helicase DDX24/MAK5